MLSDVFSADRSRVLDLLRDAPVTTGDVGKNLLHLDVSPIQRIHARWITRYSAPSAELLSKLRHNMEVL